ncbi:DUF6587 family protein [Pinirhizobacter soli]|uniref:DUF6587 family protein n=1 Tax=Pinirhizobacter soli TaxID=2786953 RepID=UPI00202A7112|nr:DUF6587 family protein [Pinirhizobacter soli]
MTAFAVIQAIVIGIALLLAAVTAFRKLLPKTATRVQARLSAALNEPSRSAWMRILGQRMQPKAATGSCGDGCGSCGSCGPKPVGNQPDVQALHFRPRARS